MSVFRREWKTDLINSCPIGDDAEVNRQGQLMLKRA